MPKKHETIRESLYRTYYRQVYAFFMRVFADAGTADVLSGDVFVEAFTRYGTFGIRSRRDLEERHDGIAVLICRMCVRRTYRWMRENPDAVIRYDWYVTDPDAPLDENPGRFVRGSISGREALRALRALPKDGGELLLLRECGELSFDALSRLYEISPASARARCLHARATFYARLSAIA